MDKEKHKDRWSQGGQIFFTGGKAWGVASDLSSICLGNETEILEALETCRHDNITIRNILVTDMNNLGSRIRPQRATRRTRMTKRGI